MSATSRAYAISTSGPRAAHGADFVDLDAGAAGRGAARPRAARPASRKPSSRRPEATLYGAPVEPALQQTSAEVDLGFVPLLALHTRQGFYADPIYGGNRNRVGWDVIGFPGPASLAEVHSGRYSTLDYFADDREHPIAKEEAS